MGEKGQLFLTLEFQLINVDVLMEIESHRLPNTTVNVAGKNHQWVLKLVSENMTRKRIFS